VKRDGVVTYIGMLESYNAYILTKSRVIVWNLLCVYVYSAIWIIYFSFTSIITKIMGLIY
jgi:hypothetical protein